jgi:hypothetical protein
MAHLAVACEAADQAFAKMVIQMAHMAGHSATLVERRHYPTADSMSVFLGQLTFEYDGALVLIGHSERAKSWMLPEIGFQWYSRSKSSIAPVLLHGVVLPDRWPVEVMSFQEDMIDSAAIDGFATFVLQL